MNHNPYSSLVDGLHSCNETGLAEKIAASVIAVAISAVLSASVPSAIYIKVGSFLAS
jgi:hypothetical protein